MEGYIESFEPPLTLGIDYSYDTDGNLTLKNAAAVAGLTPNTQLAGNELRAAKNALFTNGEGDPAEITTKTKNLFAPSDGSKEITAANLAVSAEWMSNALYITTTKDYDTATGESVLPGGNDNVVRMISAVAQERTFNADPADETSPLKFTGTYNEFLISMGGTLALDVELNANYLETSETVLTSIDNTREATSGVNLDEEASHLLTFQSAYNAAARYFTALDEMLDKLINSTGLVGR
jgi:flagellar hook-associated protein 1 FlgK